MTAELIRCYLMIVETVNHQVLSEARLNEATILLEDYLIEAGWLDSIKSTAQNYRQQYGDIKYSLLAKLTTKAMASTGNNPAVTQTLNKILKVGKFAVQNRALLVILIGMVGMLIGYAGHANVAQIAQKFNQSLDNKDFDHIVSQLSDTTLSASSASAPALSDDAQKAIRWYNNLVHEITDQNQSISDDSGTAMPGIDEIHAQALKQTQTQFGIPNDPNPDVTQSLAHPLTDEWGNSTDELQTNMASKARAKGEDLFGNSLDKQEPSSNVASNMRKWSQQVAADHNQSAQLQPVQPSNAAPVADVQPEIPATNDPVAAAQPVVKPLVPNAPQTEPMQPGVVRPLKPLNVPRPIDLSQRTRTTAG